MPAIGLTDIREMEGQLIGLTDNAVVNVLSLELSSASISNIVAIINRGRVERAYQQNTVTELCINETDRAVFEAGQNPWVQQGGTYVMTDRPNTPKRFRAVFSCTAFVQHTGSSYPCEVRLGSISFNLSNCNGEVSDGEVVYRNVPMMIYPGTYTANLIK